MIGVMAVGVMAVGSVWVWLCFRGLGLLLVLLLVALLLVLLAGAVEIAVSYSWFDPRLLDTSVTTRFVHGNESVCVNLVALFGRHKI